LKVTGHTRKEVAAKLDDLRRRHSLGEKFGAPKPTLEQFMDGWLPTYSRSVAPATYRIADNLWRNHFGPIKQVRIDRLDATMIDQWLDGIAKKPRSPNTVRLARNLLHRALRQAERLQLVVRNEAAWSTPPRIPRSEPKYLNAEQVRALLLAAQDERWGIGILLLALLGLRRGSMLALTWSDFDVQRGTLTVRTGKTAGTRRTYDLPPALVAALIRHREGAEELAALRGFEIGPSSPIVSTSVGTPVNGRNFYRLLMATGARAGIEGCNPHRLRHSLATGLLAGGADLKTVSEVLGHASVRLAGDLYAASMPATRSRALDAYADTVAPKWLPTPEVDDSEDESQAS
jgi:integrase